ncbi:putative orphan protein [Pseudoalteromonas luteoviolacea B = ATCC 29581]|nr:putative orphan protein [Pseudoalteromonas luteoviolacea B = ATCC 29581]
MRKIASVLSVVLVLAGCGEQQPSRPFDDVYRELVSLNSWLKESNQISSAHSYLPFSDEYLAKRHALYQELRSIQHTNELDYLIIDERFPQRYLPWLIQSDIAKQLSLQTKERKGQWFNLVLTRLKAAQESKIKLTRLELDTLVRFLTLEVQNGSEANSLLSYLSDYEPRTRNGLDQFPNGSEWYQSKLNYFSSDVKTPLEWMQQVTTKHADGSPSKMLAMRFNDVDSPLVLQTLSSQCKLVEGLDWQFDYLNPVLTSQQCSIEFNNNERAFWLTLMHLDVGIHYQGWNRALAQQFLASRFSDYDEQVALKIIDQIGMYPATVFVFWHKT